MNSNEILFNASKSRLRGVIRYPVQDTKKAALILHPHPLFGGTSEDHVVRFLEVVLMDHGFVTFRFDFRGTASYASSYAGVSGALDDSLAASRALVEHTGFQSHAILGYSFGGSVALHLASRVATDFLVTLSASLELAQEVEADLKSLREITCPTLMFHGDRDKMVPFTNLGSLSEILGANDVSAVAVKGGNHFYMGLAKKQVDSHLREFIEQRMND